MGIGFAIPSNIARDVSRELLANGHVQRGWLGVAAQDMDKDLAGYFKLSSDQGALISTVLPGAPGSLAALRPGDVVLKFNQHPVSSASEFKNMVGKTKPGTQAAIEIMRQATKDFRHGVSSEIGAFVYAECRCIDQLLAFFEDQPLDAEELATLRSSFFVTPAPDQILL